MGARGDQRDARQGRSPPRGEQGKGAQKRAGREAGADEKAVAQDRQAETQGPIPEPRPPHVGAGVAPIGPGQEMLQIERRIENGLAPPLNPNLDELRLGDSKTGARSLPLSAVAAMLLADLLRGLGNQWVIPGRRATALLEPRADVVGRLLLAIWAPVYRRHSDQRVRVRDGRDADAADLHLCAARTPLEWRRAAGGVVPFSADRKAAHRTLTRKVIAAPNWPDSSNRFRWPSWVAEQPAA